MILSSDDDQEVELSFRDTPFRLSNVAPGTQFTYAIYGTHNGSRSEIRPIKASWPTYAERKRLAELVRSIVDEMDAGDEDGYR